MYSRAGLSQIKIVFIVLVFFALTWYASYYMGREDKLLRDINQARGKQEDLLSIEADNKGKRRKIIVPPGTEIMPAALGIKGNAKFRKAVTEAVEVLWYADKDTYEFVRDNLSEIRNGNNTGFYKDSGGRVAEISNANAFYTKTWLAGILAHQAYHSWYERRAKNKKKKTILPPPVGKKILPNKEVDWPIPDIISHETAFAVEERCAKFQLQVLRLIGAPKREISFVANRKSRDFSYAHDGNFTITP